MLYMRHNLMSNYHNADGVGDEEMKKDILTSEVGKLIVKYPERIIENLEAENFRVSAFVKRYSRGRIAQRILVRLVTNALYESKSFAKRIADDILSGDYSFCGDAKECNFCCASSSCAFAQDGDAGKKPKMTLETGLGLASGILSGLGDIFAGKKGRKAKTEKAKYEAEKAKAEAEKALHEKTKTLSKGDKKAPIGLYAGIGVAIAVGIGAVILIVRMRK